MQALREGTPVEVRVRFESAWSDGFVVASRDPNGYLLRRQSDGSTLPCRFDQESVRPA